MTVMRVMSRNRMPACCSLNAGGSIVWSRAGPCTGKLPVYGHDRGSVIEQENSLKLSQRPEEVLLSGLRMSWTLPASEDSSLEDSPDVRAGAAQGVSASRYSC